MSAGPAPRKFRESSGRVCSRAAAARPASRPLPPATVCALGAEAVTLLHAGTHVIGKLTADEPVERGRPAGTRSSMGQAFISYVREDSSEVDALQKTLKEAGIPVWRDTSSLCLAWIGARRSAARSAPTRWLRIAFDDLAHTT